MQKHVFVIAEAGVNHNGSLTLAYQLVDAAKAAGADCVKFQTYITDNDTAESCEKAEYQKNGITCCSLRFDYNIRCHCIYAARKR